MFADLSILKGSPDRFLVSPPREGGSLLGPVVLVCYSTACGLLLALRRVAWQTAQQPVGLTQGRNQVANKPVQVPHPKFVARCCVKQTIVYRPLDRSGSPVGLSLAVTRREMIVVTSANMVFDSREYKLPVSWVSHAQAPVRCGCSCFLASGRVATGEGP